MVVTRVTDVMKWELVPYPLPLIILVNPWVISTIYIIVALIRSWVCFIDFLNMCECIFPIFAFLLCLIDWCYFNFGCINKNKELLHDGMLICFELQTILLFYYLLLFLFHLFSLLYTTNGSLISYKIVLFSLHESFSAYPCYSKTKIKRLYNQYSLNHINRKRKEKYSLNYKTHCLLLLVKQNFWACCAKMKLWGLGL